MYKRSFLAYLLLFLSVFIFLNISTAQEQPIKKKDVPRAILDAFQKSYPKAAIKGFSKETDDGKVVYEVESAEGKKHRDISYTSDGVALIIEESIAYSDLPVQIRNVITKDYSKAKVSKCEQVTKNDTTQYELLIQIGAKKQELVFNADGSIVEKEKK